MQKNTQPTPYDGLVNFYELFQVLLDAKKLIIGLTAVFMVGSILYALKLPNVYTSTAILSPVNQQASGLSGSLSRIGGLANLAGLNVGFNGESDSKVAQEIIKSWGFVEDFIGKYDLEVQLFAVNGWNKKTNSLKIDDDIYESDNQKWLLEDNDGELREPTSWELYKKFSKGLEIQEDSDGELVSLSVSHHSPYVAKQWVDLIFKEINMYMQQRKLLKVDSNIEFLQAQINKTSISHMESVFYTIIEEQIKNKMIAEATPEHTYVLVGRCMVSEIKSGPNRPAYVVFFTMLGFILSILVVLLRHSMSASRKPSAQKN